MVNARLLEIAQQELGSVPLKILVTGGTGFVGSSLARVLIAAGHDVIICGRNRYRFPIAAANVRYAEVDLCDREQILSLCQGCDLVYHAGARSTPWGTLDQFRTANVAGTKNIVDGCLLHQVPRLVHVSSTAIFFEFTDRQNIRDDTPLPAQFCCEYAQSKAEAEQVIADAVQRGLNAITIRARAVFGHGDNALLPRLITAARKGRLRQIGDGKNVIDMTHVDNLVASLLLAARRGEAGTVCTITNNEPVALWPLLKDVLAELRIESNLKRVSRTLAMAAATGLEWQHRLLQRAGEPIMTRYAAGLLSRTQTFDSSRSSEVLSYAPVIRMADAVRSTLDAMSARDEAASATSVKLTLFSTGYTAHSAHLTEHGASRKQSMRFHAMFGLIDHPTEGLSLFDTGYSPRFFAATERLPYKLYRWTTPVKTCESLSAKSILMRHGIDPTSIRRIILSHFHADHVCGLLDFPQAVILTSARAWQAVEGKRGLAAVKRAILPQLFPEDISQRLRLIEHFHGAGFGPFDSTHDVFGDGSLRMVELSGHAAGQIGLIAQRSADRGGRCLLAADAVWTSGTLRNNLPLTLGFRLLAASVKEAKASKQRLHDFYRQFPDIEIIPTHCPEVALRYGFDAEVDHWLEEPRTSSKSDRHA